MTPLERIAWIEIIDESEAAILRGVPPMRRVALMDSLCEFGRSMMLARVRRQHPGWSRDDCLREAARRIADAPE